MNSLTAGSSSWEESSSDSNGESSGSDDQSQSDSATSGSSDEVDVEDTGGDPVPDAVPHDAVQLLNEECLRHAEAECAPYPQLPLDNKQDPESKKFWETNPEIYGIRRSSRARKEPERLAVQPSVSDSDSDPGIRSRRRPKRSQRKNSSRSWLPNLSSDNSDNSESSRDFVVRRHTVRRRSIAKAKLPSKSNVALGPKDYDLERERQPSRRAAAQVSYKEQSDGSTDSEDVIEVAANDAHADASDDAEAIEKILSHRLGRPGCTGAVTTCYAPEFESLSAQGDPDPTKEPTELQFLIKWKNWAYIHSTYETEAALLQQNAKGMKRLSNYLKRKDEIEQWKAASAPEDVEYFECQQQLHLEIYNEYTVVERIIAHEYSADGGSSYPDYLCKWQGLPYSECTWEDGGLIARFHQDVIDQYLNRESSSRIPNRNAKVLKQKPRFVPAKKQPSYIGAKQNLELRDYQLDGLNWIAHSWCRGNSVILADEMGLGKTIQSISFLLYLFREHSLYGPFLVVVPLSTMAAWQKEFQLWAPDINVVVYIGDTNSRAKIQEHEWCHTNRKLKFNAILTTYEMLLRDKDLLGSIYWSVLAVDEAHRLKNDDSLLYRSLVDFKTNFRLLITGTPLQNSLKELWSLLHFIMPERFSSWEPFEAQYPITAMKDWYLKLHKELEPYLLRRVKKDVEKSLPAKVEQILRVEMSTIQKQFYKWILTKNFKSLMKGIKGNTSGFLNIVVELKKCCNHASLTRPVEETGNVDPLQSIIRGSGKTILLDKLLCRLKEKGHRVLIFSQMVRMLDILAEYCTMKHFQFQRLDGGVRGNVRKQALDRFNAEGSNDFCFLLSTRAGGLGINLATADTVIIFDSDWNPQNDLQAMARAHRIGQRKQVNIYRLVTRGTIEEDIIERAKKKMVLDHLIIQRMDTTGRKVLCKPASAPSSTTPFNKEELAAILRFGAEELFKEDDDVEDRKLQEMSIDDILEMAETHDSDAHGSSVGDELLSQFKVANLGTFKEDIQKEEESVVDGVQDQKTWAEIIPAQDRVKIEMEEEQQKQLEMFLPPRQRKTTSQVQKSGKGSHNEKVKAQQSEQSGTESSENDESERPKKKRGRPRTSKRDDVEGFSDSEIRRFIKSYKKFARPRTRLDSIAADAELLEKSMADLDRLANLLHDSCQQAVQDYQNKLQEDASFDGKKRGATIRLSSVTVNAPAILKHEEELEPLAMSIPDNAQDCLKYRIAIPTRNVHWGVQWGVADDSMLLVGLHRHGFGNWDAIKTDQSLGLGSKILLPGVAKPLEKHLQSRAEYLVKLLRQQSRPAESCKSGKVAKPRPKKKHPPPPEEKPSAVTPPAVADSISADAESSAANHRVMVTCDNGVKDAKRHRTGHDEKRDMPGSRPKTPRTSKSPCIGKPPDGVSSVSAAVEPTAHVLDGVHEVADMSRDTFTLCKERMRPVKRALRQLESPDDDMADRDQVINTRQCLLRIGNHIEKHLESLSKDHDIPQWRSNLWTFVSKFTAFDARKLFSLYRIAVKKKDSSRDEKRLVPKPRSSSAGQRSMPDGDERPAMGDLSFEPHSTLKGGITVEDSDYRDRRKGAPMRDLRPPHPSSWQQSNHRASRRDRSRSPIGGQAVDSSSGGGAHHKRDGQRQRHRSRQSPNDNHAPRQHRSSSGLTVIEVDRSRKGHHATEAALHRHHRHRERHES